MIGSIIGSIIKGVAPLALNMGSQIIKTKIEENVFDACEKQLFNQALNAVTDCVVAGIQESNKQEEPKQVIQQIYIPQQPVAYQQPYRINDCLSIEDNSKYHFELRDFR